MDRCGTVRERPNKALLMEKYFRPKATNTPKDQLHIAKRKASL